MSLFERATMQKIRFQYKGICSTEELWDLRVEELDEIYRDLKAEQKELVGDSLIRKATSATTVLNLKVDVVKHIVEVKLEAAESRKVRAANKMRKDKIADILAQKQDQKLLDMSEEDLQAELKAIE